MKLNSLLRTITVSGLIVGLSLPLSSSFANQSRSFAQNCQLGSECPIPGNDGGSTYYSIQPENGTNYVCEVKAESGSLKFAVISGKDFDITQGKGVYNANPTTTVEIKGRFKNPENAKDEGQIKFLKLPMSSDGSVKCSPKS